MHHKPPQHRLHRCGANGIKRHKIKHRKPSLNDFKAHDKEYPSGFDIAAVQADMAAIVEGVPEDLQISNIGEQGFNPNWPVIVRSFKDAEGANVAAAILQHPSLDEMLQTPEARAYLERILSAAFMRQLSGSLTTWLKSDRTEPISLASKVGDFITTARRVASTGKRRFSKILWNKYRSIMMERLVQLYAQSGITLEITVAKFEQCLENQAAASAFYPQVKPEVWEAFVDLLCKLPAETVVNEKTNNSVTDDGELFRHWKATRNDASDDDEVDIDLSSLGALSL